MNLLMQTKDAPRLPVLPFFLVTNAMLSCLIAVWPRWPMRLATFILYISIGFHVVVFTTTGTILEDYSMGCTIFGQILTATYLLWLTNPLENFRHEQDAVAPASRPILRRVYSALCVLQNHRGVGWNYHVSFQAWVD